MNIKNRKNLIILGAAAGVLMVIISLFSHGEKTDKTPVTYYSTELEEKITNLISSVENVSDVSVMVTLDCGTENVYAQNTENSSDRKVSDYAVISGEGDGALKLKEIYPKVRGVAVVCHGGDNTAVQAKITALLTSALGVPSNRITVCG